MSLIPNSKRGPQSGSWNPDNSFILNNMAERVGFAIPPVLKTKELVENTVSQISTIAPSAGV
jgi:hypothetical protein